MDKILSIIGTVVGAAYAVFLAVFALDAGSMPAAAVHLVPAFAVAVVACAGSRRAFYGGILSAVLAVVFTFFFHSYRDALSFLLISLPLCAMSALFILSAILHHR